MPAVRKPGSFRFYTKREDASERAPDWKGYFTAFPTEGKEDGVTYSIAIWRAEDGGFSGRIEPEKPKDEPF